MILMCARMYVVFYAYAQLKACQLNTLIVSDTASVYTTTAETLPKTQ